MRMFDTYDGKQMKIGPRVCANYHIGDKVPEEVPDGLYFCLEGWIVIHSNVLVASGTDMFTKWGDQIDFKLNMKMDDPIWRTLFARKPQQGV